MLVRALAIGSLLAVFGGGALGAERVRGPGNVQLGDGTSLVLEGNTSVAVDRDSTPGRISATAQPSDVTVADRPPDCYTVSASVTGHDRGNPMILLGCVAVSAEGQ